MSRRGGQSGTVVKKGKLVARPRRKLAVMLHKVGVNDNSYLEKTLTTVKLFCEHAEWWEANVLPMHKPSSQNSSHYILKRTLLTVQPAPPFFTGSLRHQRQILKNRFLCQMLVPKR